MKSFYVSGKVSKIENKTSRANKPYSMIYIEDKNGTVELVASGKVDLPPVGSCVLCGGTIRSTPRPYQDRVFYSYSFLVEEIDTITELEVSSHEESLPESSLQEVNFSDVNIPF